MCSKHKYVAAYTGETYKTTTTIFTDNVLIWRTPKKMKAPFPYAVETHTQMRQLLMEAHCHVLSLVSACVCSSVLSTSLLVTSPISNDIFCEIHFSETG